MSRVILTFETLFQVLAADKFLRGQIDCRPTPTPPGLSTAVCGVSLEILNLQQRENAIKLLQEKSLSPNGIHELP